MSSIGSWAYVNKATVRPFIEMLPNGKARYGEPFSIDCYFTSKKEPVITQDGVQFISSMVFLTENSRVKVLDLIAGKTVRSVEILNSTPFGETVMDYRIWV